MEKTSLTLAQAHLMCVQSILQLQQLHQAAGNTAVIKSECKSPELVNTLRDRALQLGAGTKTRLLPVSVTGQGNLLVLRERVWGLKIGNMLVFDAGNYSLQSLLGFACNIPMAKVYSDRIICYYANGRRVMQKADPIALVNRFRTPPMRDWMRIDFEAAARFFPEETAKLRRGYPDISPKNWRLLTDANVETLVLAQDETYDHFIPFHCVMNGSPVSLDYCDPILGKLNGYGNLQPLFHEFATLLANGHYREIAKDKKLRCFERGYYARETGERSLYPGVSELELKVGFADIPFEQAILLAKNQTELRHRYVRGERLFSVDADGNVLNARNVVNSRNFKPGGQRIILLPDNVYEAWGKDFSSEMLEFLAKERTFDYGIYGNDFIRNVSGQELEQFKTLKKFAKAAGFGVKTATKIGLGAAKIVGASCVITAQNACKFASFAFDEIAYQFEGTYASEGADLSAPTRRGCITGRIHYSGRSYGDFDW